MTALYFKDRARMADKSTWAKEELPSDYTNEEVKLAAFHAGVDGYAIVENFGKPNQRIVLFKWFNKK